MRWKIFKEIPRWNRINASEHGCKFWWLEYGGRLDTIHDTEEIKWKYGMGRLWRLELYKKSGNFPEQKR